MPPATLTCDRNDLTSYNGRLVEYTETGTSLRIVIDTDWDTRESVLVEHTPGQDPKTSFLLHGEPFEDDDWLRIDATTENRDPAIGIQLVAWVCLDDETPPVIDWRP